MTVGEKVKYFRKQKALTQESLGKLCGMSAVMIRRYEAGTRNPKYETLQKIANSLEIDVMELMPTNTKFIENDLNSLSSDFQALRQRYRSLQKYLFNDEEFTLIYRALVEYKDCLCLLLDDYSYFEIYNKINGIKVPRERMEKDVAILETLINDAFQPSIVLY